MSGAVNMMAAPDLTRTYTPDSGTGTFTDTKNLPYELGTVIPSNDGLKRYKLVIVEDLVTVVGQLACYTTDDNGFEVTIDRAGGTSDNTQPAGLIVTVIADGDVGWIQTYGLSEQDITTDNAVAAGEGIIPHATTNGGVDSDDGNQTGPTSFGQALDDDTSITLSAGEVFLDCPKG